MLQQISPAGGRFGRRRLSLRFLVSEVEDAYLSSRTAEMQTNGSSALFLLAIAAFVRAMVTSDLKGEDSMCDVNQSLSAAHLASNLAIGAFGLGGGLALRVPLLRGILGYRFLECVAVFVHLAMAAYWSAFPTACRLADQNDGLRKFLRMAVFLICSHHFVPMRFCVIAWADAIVLGAGVSWLQDAEGDAISLLNFLLIGAMALVGLRNSEVRAREQFTAIVGERKLRAEAEFQRELSSPRRASKARRVPDDDISALTSTDTADLFRTSDGAKQFCELEDLGVQEHWLIEQSELQVDFMKVLGRGSFGLVVEGTFCCSPVAVKVHPSGGPSGHHLESVGKMALNELRVLRRVRHPNIVLFHGACIHTASDGVSELRLVLERLEGVTLKRFVSQERADPLLWLNPSSRRQIMTGLCGAMVYLHSRKPPIVHGDLKHSNVMVETPRTHPCTKLLDFGLSRVVSRSITAACGTQAFMAPEALRGHAPKARPAVDVYSLGRLLLYVATGHLDASVDPSCLTDCVLFEDWRGMVEACTRDGPSERPSADEVHRCLFQRRRGSPKSEPRVSRPGPARISLSL